MDEEQICECGSIMTEESFGSPNGTIYVYTCIECGEEITFP